MKMGRTDYLIVYESNELELIEKTDQVIEQLNEYASERRWASRA